MKGECQIIKMIDIPGATQINKRTCEALSLIGEGVFLGGEPMLFNRPHSYSVKVVSQSAEIICANPEYFIQRMKDILPDVSSHIEARCAWVAHRQASISSYKAIGFCATMTDLNRGNNNDILQEPKEGCSSNKKKILFMLRRNKMISDSKNQGIQTLQKVKSLDAKDMQTAGFPLFSYKNLTNFRALPLIEELSKLISPCDTALIDRKKNKLIPVKQKKQEGHKMLQNVTNQRIHLKSPTSGLVLSHDINQHFLQAPTGLVSPQFSHSQTSFHNFLEVSKNSIANAYLTNYKADLKRTSLGESADFLIKSMHNTQSLLEYSKGYLNSSQNVKTTKAPFKMYSTISSPHLELIPKKNQSFMANIIAQGSIVGDHYKQQ